MIIEWCSSKPKPPSQDRALLDQSIRDLRMEYKLTRYWLSMGKTTLKSRVRKLGRDLRALEATIPALTIGGLTYWQTDAVIHEMEALDSNYTFTIEANGSGHDVWRSGPSDWTTAIDDFVTDITNIAPIDTREDDLDDE